MKLHSLLDNLAVTVEEEEEEGEEEEEEDVWEKNPSISEMFQNGVSTDYLVIVFLTFLICISVLGRYVLFRIYLRYLLLVKIRNTGHRQSALTNH